ncbi:ADC synthase [Hanseniaspora valbyensis NRRL Y-1626]|uniref:ADC synthase n=1 Tax=Hanseniaspora valbyensis NRRL Y-1626 TaxID=766949 RepID=A0A1B7TFE6_9ASCO|nr:ADC synthase [Hanseniaspora valbyensis NRRL Y-1626]
MIFIGPGPGSPTSKNDTGLIYDLLKEVSSDMTKYRKIPIFGVCLGFQAICHHLDSASNKNHNEIKYLAKPVHGQVASLKLINEEHPIFKDIILDDTELLGTRYHSIYYSARMDKETYDSHAEFKVDPIAVTNDDILMAASISNTSIMGVQYHLESCCSNHGLNVLCNYIEKHVVPYYLSKERHDYIGNICEYLKGEEECFELLSNKNEESDSGSGKKEFNVDVHSHYVHEKDLIGLHLNLISLFKKMFGGCLMLGSLVKQKHRGEFSIFGIPNDSSSYYYYDLTEESIYKDDWQNESTAALISNDCDRKSYYQFIEKEFQTWQNNINVSSENEAIFNSLPFTGGYLGILNYEMGDCVPKLAKYSNSIGAIFAKINQALVWDHFEDKFYFIDITQQKNNNNNNNNNNKNDWNKEMIETVLKEIKNNNEDQTSSKETLLKTKFPVSNIEKSDFETYSEQFSRCQEYLHKGDSYELCLTTQCKVTLSEKIDPFVLFSKLSNMNPAPFSSYMSFPKIDINLLSSSPERFIKWDQNLDNVELRPIKGTVSKKKDPKMTLEKATSILKTPKEFGENLMIVDLIRNDLYKLLQEVELKELMSVEEYETVYQLVSVIKGSKPKKGHHSGLTGLDILKSSSPPGSMTGAPKIKSVELLQEEIESLYVNERGIYSGVTGFYSLNKKGDWSVNIRCLFSNDNINWRLGAGGAITVLSDLDGEYEEMKIKLESALQIFE